MPDAPPVSPPSEAKLPFRRMPMVKWFTPSELARTGVKALLSKLFGAYADNREIQALRPDLTDPPPVPPPGGSYPTGNYSSYDHLWLDYVADVGDGFNATYSVAQLLAAPVVTAGGYRTQRGQVLVMGGDQAYPTATKEAYQNRLEGPYRSALPYVTSGQTPPHLYAIPGNHDWYDGLTSFTRLFCQQRWIGGWKTHQSRSYFALKLPHQWWLWGLDIQLGSDIDEPQLRYFQRIGQSIPAGGRIILCLAEPTWVTTDRKGIAAYDNLAVFEDKAIRAYGHEHVVGLAGDLHAYARYRSEDGRQRFVSGGGGAYLYPTHRLPEHLELPTAKPTDRTPETVTTFSLGKHGDSPTGLPPTDAHPEEPALFPSPQRSRAYMLKGILFAWYNRSFALFFGCYYLVLAWLVESAGMALTRQDLPPTRATAGFSFLEAAVSGFGPMLAKLGSILPQAPLAAGAVATLAAGLIAFADAKGPRGKVALGLAHTVMHIAGFLAVTWFLLQLQQNWLGDLLQGFGSSPRSSGQVLLFSVLMLVVGSTVAGAVWGLYLLVAHSLGRDTHSHDVLACQSIPDFKHVLRLHISREGLTLYPLGLEEVPRRWQYQPGVTDGRPWFTPDDGAGPVHERAVLIEPPVFVERPASNPMMPPAPPVT